MTIGSTIQHMRHEWRKKRHAGPIVEAHKHSSDHRAELEESIFAGCFYCCETFKVSSIYEWIDDSQCAMCPKCGIDSVIGDASGFPINDKKFLQQMKGLWFS